MRSGKELIGKQIISITDGRSLGTVKDLYVDPDLNWLTAVYLGSEGLFKRKANLIRRSDITVFGIDAILVKNSEVVTDDKQLPEAETWLRLDKLKGRDVDTPGGTKLGTVGDVLLDEDAKIGGFGMAKTHVEGPIAEKGTFPREAVIDTGREDGGMTIDLAKAEAYHRGKPPVE